METVLNTLRTSEVQSGEALCYSFQVPQEAEDQRLDSFLAIQMPDQISRSRIKALIKEGQLRLNDQICLSASQKLKHGDLIELTMPEAEDPVPSGEAIALEVLFEDDHLIVIAKPAGMVVHPAPGNWHGTLVNALIHHCGDSLQGIGGIKRPGIVHRLDKDTSGVMVVAKTQQAHTSLSEQFADHGREGHLMRAYQAIVWGHIQKKSGIVDAPLGRSTKNRARRAVVPPDAADARHARTHYQLQAYLDGNCDGEADATLVRCVLETGRTHQIRVHLAHIGHPLIGDRDYGAHFQTKINKLAEPVRQLAGAFGRQALHGRELQFMHPATGQIMYFEHEPPEDFCTLLAAFDKLS
jgi:23S rRNA pseudouridine1911/1915/1917 synthase